jgi:uncharacterized membrane protein
VAKDEVIMSQVVGDSSSSKGGSAMDTLIGSILLIGVLTSILLLVVGTLWHWIATGTLEFDYPIQGMNLWEFLWTSLGQVVRGAMQPQTVIDLGLSVLLLTPYARVLASMLYFLLAERNWKYTLFTLFVFSVLTYSLFLRQ